MCNICCIFIKYMHFIMFLYVNFPSIPLQAEEDGAYRWLNNPPYSSTLARVVNYSYSIFTV